MIRRNTGYMVSGMSLALLLVVAGCKTTSTPVVGDALDSLTGQHDAAEERLSTAAETAIAEGKTEQALAFYEKLYADPHSISLGTNHYRDYDIALNYAQLLRKTGRAQQAAEVLSPFAETRYGKIKGDAEPIVLNEFAAIQIDLGEFKKAETILNGVLEDNRTRKFYADAYNLMGIALDAQGQHKEAEQSLRQALSMWRGDPASVMNNLAVCLASQGLFDEAIVTLRQALIMSPRKQEIAHNIQLVSELRQSLLSSHKSPMAGARQKKEPVSTAPDGGHDSVKKDGQ
ncbi:MAG: tetratricopeptide repeat protein [Proteobacteria bacterium]|nr:tetratricopeptide repeat protein [Pseudomonadota bacterium]